MVSMACSLCRALFCSLSGSLGLPIYYRRVRRRCTAFRVRFCERWPEQRKRRKERETKHAPEVIQQIAFDKLEVGRQIVSLFGKSEADPSVKEFSGAPLMFYFLL